MLKYSSLSSYFLIPQFMCTALRISYPEYCLKEDNISGKKNEILMLLLSYKIWHVQFEYLKCSTLVEALLGSSQQEIVPNWQL